MGERITDHFITCRASPWSELDPTYIDHRLHRNFNPLIVTGGSYLVVAVLSSNLSSNPSSTIPAPSSSRDLTFHRRNFPHCSSWSAHSLAHSLTAIDLVIAAARMHSTRFEFNHLVGRKHLIEIPRKPEPDELAAY